VWRKVINQNTVLWGIRVGFFIIFTSTLWKFYGDFSAKVERERENIFKPTIANVTLHQDCNCNGVRVVKCATSKICL
jgi:hypothetical protein